MTSDKKKKLSPATVRQRVLKLIDKIEALRREIDAIKSRCSHEWGYSSDPSGGSDSGYYCLACQSTRRNLS